MAAIDLALWDIKGKALKLPVHELLGGARRDAVRCYATHPLGRNLEETGRFAASLRDAGFSAVKFGWHPLGRDAVEDEAIVRCLRQAIGPEADLPIDGGLAWDLETALDRLRRFESYRFSGLRSRCEPMILTATPNSQPRPSAHKCLAAAERFDHRLLVHPWAVPSNQITSGGSST
jgi:L-rhamnonate dehydratase